MIIEKISLWKPRAFAFFRKFRLLLKLPSPLFASWKSLRPSSETMRFTIFGVVIASSRSIVPLVIVCMKMPSDVRVLMSSGKYFRAKTSPPQKVMV